jgi:Gnt-I system high-affinity gluconate transporter
MLEKKSNMPLLIVALGVLFLLALILLKVKPLYALLAVSLLVGWGEGMGFVPTLRSIGLGIWDTVKSIAPVLCLGAMLGKMIETSGAANRITDTLMAWFGKKNIQWAVMLTGLIVGIPLFYNAGFVILIPLIFSIALSAEVPILLVGIPMAASLSVTHGFLPPHPGPTAIVAIFHADFGKTLLLGLVIAIPAAILAGPIFSRSLKKMKVVIPQEKMMKKALHQLPNPRVSFFIALFPVVLIALCAVLQMNIANDKFIHAFEFFGNPITALSLALLLAIYIFGLKENKKSAELVSTLFQSVRDIALVVLIIAAGGGFKQVLIDSGVGIYIKTITTDFALSPLLLAWSVAALIRVSLGSATVAGLTAAGIILPFLSAPGVHPELMVLSVGAGSLMFSHVNDTGFWMFKEYFNLSLKQTFLSWTMMETIISLAGLAGVFILDKII